MKFHAEYVDPATREQISVVFVYPSLEYVGNPPYAIVAAWESIIAERLGDTLPAGEIYELLIERANRYEQKTPPHIG